MRVYEQRVAEVARSSLERERDEVAKAAFGQCVLARKQAIVGSHRQRRAPRHRCGQDHQPEPARKRRRDRLLEEEPHMRTSSGTRPLDCRNDVKLATRIPNCLGILAPRAAVQVDRQQPARIVRKDGVDAHHLSAPKMGKQLGPIRRLERLVGTLTTPDCRFRADTRLPLVATARRPAAPALVALFPPHGKHVLTASKEPGEHRELELRSQLRVTGWTHRRRLVAIGAKSLDPPLHPKA